MHKYIVIVVLSLMLFGCGKSNPMVGTTWESTNASGLWNYSHYYDGDFSRQLSFDEDMVHDIILRNGYKYHDNGWYKYTYEKKDGTEWVYIDRGDNIDQGNLAESHKVMYINIFSTYYRQ